jgi:Protein of unknown function (DUF2510)
VGFYYGSGGGHEGWLVLIPIILLVAMRMLAVRNRRSRMGGGRPPMPRGSYFTGGSGPAVGSGPVFDDPVVEEPQRTGMAAGWLPDPTGRHGERYWSGTGWTEHVRTGGVPDTDPYPGAPGGDESGTTGEPEPPKEG